ncbi:hypothetical protein A249_02045 [Pseudomonas syringae pv. actinidiae ICMP 18804]|nr:hypothetical protein A249_02045 [Pseudomonas syringae pv. actinidiae ICMP 18804]KTC49629.1 hypothetical protein AO250_26100 [Pseudomonas syringae pv. actinidiae ICMP 19497]
MQAAVQMNDILAACALMKVIYILGDHSQPGHMFGKLSDSEMPFIGLRPENFVPTPFVPSPTQARVCSEGFAGGKLARIEALP